MHSFVIFPCSGHFVCDKKSKKAATVEWIHHHQHRWVPSRCAGSGTYVWMCGTEQRLHILSVSHTQSAEWRWNQIHHVLHPTLFSFVFCIYFTRNRCSPIWRSQLGVRLSFFSVFFFFFFLRNDFYKLKLTICSDYNAMRDYSSERQSRKWTNCT